MVKKIITALCLCILAACAATSKFAPSADELSVMQSKVPGISYNEAIQGYNLYATYCSNCHRLHNPKEYTAVQWNKILLEMFDKAKLRDEKNLALIRNYLIAKSKN